MTTSRYIGFWVGSYMTPAPHVPEACGQGILRGRLNIDSAEITLRLASDQTRDPSYLARKGKLLAVVSERPDAEGELHLYCIGADGSLSLEQVIPTHGHHPCHVTFVGNLICVANYLGDRLVYYKPIDNGIWETVALNPYRGSGPNPERQERPHLHHILHLPKLGLVAVSDLGSDRIWLHHCDETGIDPAPMNALHLPTGSGPRHLVFSEHSQCLYALCELSGVIESFTLASNQWQRLNNAFGKSRPLPGGSAIRLHPSIPILYAASRGEGRIGVFHINRDGTLQEDLSLVTCGRMPRDFAITLNGEYLLVANQDSHSLAVASLCGQRTPKIRTKLSCGSPVCILFDKEI